MAQQVNISRDDYRVFYPISTRWQDNDSYGRISNAACYSYFDTAVNNFLIAQCGWDISDDIAGLVVSSGCDYLSSIAFPDKLEVGLRVDSLGRSSVHYSAGLFKRKSIQACAFGHMVHVFVDRELNKSVDIPDGVRNKMKKLQVAVN